MRDRLRAIVKYLLFLGAVMLVLWIGGRLALRWLERAKWSPDGLDVVRVAAGVYLFRWISDGWSSMAAALMSFYKAWIE
jgi:hypothetical protein